MRTKFFPVCHIFLFSFAFQEQLEKASESKQLNSTVGVENKTAWPQLEGGLKTAAVLLLFRLRYNVYKMQTTDFFRKYLSYPFKMKWIRNPTPLIILGFNNHIRFLEHHRSQLLLLDDSQH